MQYWLSLTSLDHKTQVNLKSIEVLITMFRPLLWQLMAALDTSFFWSLYVRQPILKHFLIWEIKTVSRQDIGRHLHLILIRKKHVSWLYSTPVAEYKPQTGYQYKWYFTEAPSFPDLGITLMSKLVGPSCSIHSPYIQVCPNKINQA